jgi:hypothetical protein
LKKKEIERLSVVLGSAGQIALSVGYLGYISNASLFLSSVLLGISHFWSMEVDFKYKIQVRPFAYLPFPLAAAVIGQQLHKFDVVTQGALLFLSSVANNRFWTLGPKKME